MSQAPGSPGLQDQTQRGYNPPFNTQFSVFLDNRVGKLHELVEMFSQQPARLVALSVIDSADYAVVRMVTTNADRSRKLLQLHALPFTEVEIIVVELDSTKRLSHLCLALLAAEVNIYYAYPLMARHHGAATIALYTDEQLLSGQILLRKGFNLLGEEDLAADAGG